MPDSTNSAESDSGEKMSTTDEVDSHNWSDEDSDSGSESDEENEDEFSISGTHDEAKRRAKKMRRKRSSRQKRTLQSDTETRNLLDDVGDDDEYIDLEESKENSKIALRFFEMSEEQLDYYTKCFLCLQQKTGGQPTISGAVSGADERVVEFFRKSRLDTRTLSKVWALADVNEDGFLNHAEFVLAMHLIVLHVKGRVPVPSRLPSPVRPCVTPTRSLQYPHGSELQNSTASSTLSSGADNASTSRGSDPAQTSQTSSKRPDIHQYSHPPQTANSRLMPMSTLAADGSGHKQQSLSDDHLHVHTQQRDNLVTDFSDAPPVLVDNRPTALNASTSSTAFTLLSSLASRGPPPVPPARAYTTDGTAVKGHGRSVSLDLNTFAAVSGHPPLPPNPASAAMFQSTTSGGNSTVGRQPQTQFYEKPASSADAKFANRADPAFFAQSGVDGAFGVSTSSAGDHSSHPPVDEANVTTGSAPNVGTATSTAFQRLPALHHQSASLSAGTTFVTSAIVHPPPPPLRPTPWTVYSRPPPSSVQRTTASTQTDIVSLDQEDSQLSRGLHGSIRPALLDERTFAQLMEGAERMAPAERCVVLRRYNAELENERATLAQIRLQLQLRIDEAESALHEFGIRTCADPLVANESTAPPLKPTVL